MDDTGVVESHPDVRGIRDEGGRRELRDGDASPTILCVTGSIWISAAGQSGSGSYTDSDDDRGSGEKRARSGSRTSRTRPDRGSQHNPGRRRRTGPDLPTPCGRLNFILQGDTRSADTYLAMGTTRLRKGAPGSIPSVVSGASVPLRAACELTGVDVGQIRRWAEDGAIEIEQRGELEVVRLDLVEALSDPPKPIRDRRYMLRRLLEGAKLETRSVAELQRLAREREPVTA